jgi:hypothetical protein
VKSFIFNLHVTHIILINLCRITLLFDLLIQIEVKVVLTWIYIAHDFFYTYLVILVPKITKLAVSGNLI